MGTWLGKMKSQLALEEHVGKPVPKEGMTVSMSADQAMRARGQVPLLASPQPVRLTAALNATTKGADSVRGSPPQATAAGAALKAAANVVVPALIAAVGGGGGV